MKFVFEDLLIRGKEFSVNVSAEDYKTALTKLTLYVLKRFDLPKSRFHTERNNIIDNIEKGYFNVKTSPEPEQSEFSFESTHKSDNDLIWECYKFNK